jgi:hypothetical protein
LKKILLLSIFLNAFAFSSFSQLAHWRQQVNYKIRVRLNDSSNTLDGYEQMDYHNNSPDTLHYIWIHLWANAFKNDRTAYSDELLDLGHTEFYFSDDDKKGYINRLNFKVNGIIAETEDHPAEQDIIQLILPTPLYPGAHINIETPFHIKLPYNFFGNGYKQHSYQINQWYPKPAVYDTAGWHDMPYVLQDGSHNERGNYEVTITVPKRYMVVSNGSNLSTIITDSSLPYKTILFKQDSTTDFTWIADKHLSKQVILFPGLIAEQDSLDKTYTPEQSAKQTKFIFLFNTKEKNKYNYISAGPILGYNNYDKLMIGAAIHNYQSPSPKFKFIIAPLYGIESKQLNGIGKLSYTWHPVDHFQKIELGVNGARFSTNETLDTTGANIFQDFYKIVPSLRFYFKHPMKSKLISWLDIRTFFIGEKQFSNFGVITGSDSITSYPFTSIQSTRYLNQVTYNNENNRILYPYNYQVQLQQGTGFYRVNLTGNYFFNYSKGGGLKVRLFAAKFGLVGPVNYTAYGYEPKLLAGNGGDDYTYSDYFLGRTASTANPDVPSSPLSNHGIAEQQITTYNEGGLKLRRDQFGYLQGQSADWVAAMNFNTTLPQSILPPVIPLTFFFDIGTYAEAWEANPTTNKFLYVGGLQLSLFKNVLNIYAPFIFCSDFENSYIADPENNTFFKKVTFSIDVQNITLRKLAPQLSF